MRVTRIVSISPSQNSVDPVVEIHVEASFERDRELPLRIDGALRSDDRTLAYLYEELERTSFRVSGAGRSGFDANQRNLKLRVPLSARGLDAIEEVRASDPHGDVRLQLGLAVRTLKVNSYIPEHLALLTAQQNRQQQPTLAGTLVEAERSGHLNPDRSPRLLALNNNVDLFEVEVEESKLPFVIPASDWVQRYAPAFGIGRYLLFEYALPDPPRPDAPLLERLAEAVSTLQQMQEYMAAGDWTLVVREARSVAELLRREGDALKALVEQDGLPPEAASDLTASLRHLFHYASKFSHRLDRKENVLPQFKASKEDAHLAFAITSGVVNLITSKLRRIQDV